jgi:hypothetical protein
MEFYLHSFYGPSLPAMTRSLPFLPWFLTTVNVTLTVVLDVTPCCSVDGKPTFRKMCCVRVRGRQCGGKGCLEKMGSPNCMASYFKRPQSSFCNIAKLCLGLAVPLLRVLSCTGTYAAVTELYGTHFSFCKLRNSLL